MLTAIPNHSRHAAAAERLSWPDTARFVIPLLRVCWLSRRLEVGTAA
ncbi:hypothetical protein MKK69_04065 [Methylobacterium sp. J-026]|nr:hypothetical protein [Methylobacterium sp. J-026]MCJ2133248.1 hypothetical protein [Methylobacterium sp. J-026]